jgi:LysR family glycine cleavage system transcriptional activator
VSVELVPVHSAEAAQPQADLRILWVGEGEDGAGELQQPLFQEQVFPVCSPRLLPGAAPLAEPAALQRLTLLHKASGGAGEWSWSVWLRRLGLPQAPAAPEMRFAELGLVLSAAVDGAGVALARSLLAHDALRDGRLVLPLRGIEPLLSSKRHVARWRRDRADDPDLRAFVSWLTGQASETLQSTEALLR